MPKSAPTRLLDGLASVSLGLSIAGLVAITGIIAAAVVSRYLLGSPLPWAEQAALVAQLWLVLLGAAVGVHEGFHIRLSAAVDAMPPGWRIIAAIAAEGVVMLVGLAMLVHGADLVRRTWDHAVPTLGISRGATYLAIPLSGALMALFAFARAVSAARAILPWR